MNRHAPAVLGLTRKGWIKAGPDHRYLRAPCIGCHEMVFVRASGTYGAFGRRHSCPVSAAA